MTEDHDKICPRILIVDDDPDHCRLLRDSLLMYYHMEADSKVTMVQSGRDCLQCPLKQFDVVLLDLHLPDLSGLEVLRGILDQADLPVIFVTGEQDLSIATQAIETGAQDYVVKHGDYLFAIPAIVQKNISLHKIKLEHDRLQLRLKWMLEELRHKNEQLEESMEQLKLLATTDPLTGLYNRRYFNEQLAQQFSQAVRYQQDLTCCMIDLDHYKVYNDTLGHQRGDDLLRHMGEIINDSMRQSDIAARYGGDEFILLLPQTTIRAAGQLVERIRSRMSAPAAGFSQAPCPVTLSVGIASLLSDFPRSDEGLIAMADRALYQAKDRGKNCVVFFTDIRETVGPPRERPADSPGGPPLPEPFRN
jgi:diguanylate cyclase (GGDEF)-like protein